MGGRAPRGVRCLEAGGGGVHWGMAGMGRMAATGGANAAVNCGRPELGAPGGGVRCGTRVPLARMEAACCAWRAELEEASAEKGASPVRGGVVIWWGGEE